MVDPEEVSMLKYVPVSEVNGIECVQIKPDDVVPEIKYWQSRVLCSVLGVNPPLEVMEGYFRRVWHHRDIDKICLARKGYSLCDSPPWRAGCKL